MDTPEFQIPYYLFPLPPPVGNFNVIEFNYGFSLHNFLKMEQKTAILILEDGTTCYGKAFGAIGTTGGEICFNTGMTGYQEVFTDPSYYGQVLIMNSVHVGNYGVADVDVESDSIKIRGLIGRNLEEMFSRRMAQGSLDEYLKMQNIVAIEGVDTRALVTHIRSKGAMNCIISSEILDENVLKNKLNEVTDMSGLELASVVSTPAAYELGDPSSKIKIAVLDYGTKRNIFNCMVERGAHVKVFPAKTSLEELKKFNPSGYFISNGPGDPASMDYAVNTMKEIL
jgi:carbamoyl-phosphate synthase small subunit